MAEERFIETGKSSFYGEYLYDQGVPKDHFFRKLNELMDWRKYTQKMMRWYKGRAEYGRPPFDPVVLLKMLLVAYLYNLSERQTEQYINDSMSAKYFLGLGMDQPAPDHSTLTRFKERIILRRRELKLEALLTEIVQTALANGVKFGSIQVVDSTHSTADVDTWKDAERKSQGKGCRDPHASWGSKGKKRFKDAHGETHEQHKYFYGYKTHVSLNAESGLVTSVTVSSGRAYDGSYLPDLVKADICTGVMVGVVAADRGYDDSAHHYWLEQQGIRSAICLKRNRTEKKDANKEVWLKLKESASYRQGLAQRYKVEQKFGEAKRYHGLRRCRYLGLNKYRIQVVLTVMALNLKRMVKLVDGVGFRSASPGFA